MPQLHKTNCHPPAGPENLFEFFEFRRGGQVVEGAPLCGLTLRAAGSMRFRWNENNPNRTAVVEALETTGQLVPVQLDHTHIVYDVHEATDTQDKIGDGIITTNRTLVPTVTVADCMPLYLYDPVSGVFGIVHSGWKGTGIIVDAMQLAARNYGARLSDFCVVLGPHIRDCCYIVNKERADWFAQNFTPACIRPLEAGVKVDWNTGGGPLFRLSLEKANLAALQKAGVPEENIWIHPACTCCTKVDGEYIYGSNRRETKLNGAPDKFTVQAAFVVNGLPRR